MRVAWLLTTNYPPIAGGVSRYNEGLVATAQGKIAVAGIDGFDHPPGGDGFGARLRQIVWARKVSREIPHEMQILVSPPHLALGVVLSRKHFVQFIHGGEWEDYPCGRYLLNRLLRVARETVVNSVATQHRWLSPRLFHKVRVIRPGLSAITPIDKRDYSLRKQVSTSGRSFRVVAVARLSARKGFERLIKAVKLLRERGVPIELQIVGSGPMEPKLRLLSGDDHYITFLTDASDAELVRSYDSADLFALVPKEIKGGEAWEGFGIVYLEAAARGLPIFASRSGGIPEAVSPEGSILLDEECSEKDIADALSELILNPQKLREMSVANIEWAEKNTWESRRDLIQQLLSGNPRGDQ